MKIVGRDIEKDITGEYFWETPNQGWILNPKMAKNFANEFGLADNSPEKINRKLHTDSWRRIGKSGNLAFVGKSSWENSEFDQAIIYKLSVKKSK